MTTPETCDECYSFGHKGQIVARKVRLCPLHRAAGRLLEAVKRLSDENLRLGCEAMKFASKVIKEAEDD